MITFILQDIRIETAKTKTGAATIIIKLRETVGSVRLSATEKEKN